MGPDAGLDAACSFMSYHAGERGGREFWWLFPAPETPLPQLLPRDICLEAECSCWAAHHLRLWLLASLLADLGLPQCSGESLPAVRIQGHPQIQHLTVPLYPTSHHIPEFLSGWKGLRLHSGACRLTFLLGAGDMWTSRAVCEGLDVASHASSKFKGSGSLCLKCVCLTSWSEEELSSVVQGGPGADTAGFISLQIGAMTTGSSSMTVPWTAQACG